MNIPVAYEDKWLLVVNKPARLLTIATPKKEVHTLTGILNNDLKKKGLTYRLHPCHRLDRETSGLIIYAKGKSIQKKMMDMFKQRRIKKTYVAFVQGILPISQGQIRTPIEGKKAVTEYKIIEARENFTIVEVMPQTGRKNQLRIHFKSVGHPIVGETRFAFRRDYTLRAKRVCLHANTLQFLHPVTGNGVTVNSELAPDLVEFLRKNPN